MKVLRTISITLATAVGIAVAAQVALAGGEPKNEWPFTRPVADRTLSQVRQPAGFTQVPYGEPKNEWPFTRPVGDRAPATLAAPARRTQSPASGGEAKNEPPFTRPALAPTVVIGAKSGFEWGDAGIGAGATLGLVIAALGAATLRTSQSRHPRTTGV